MILLLFSGMMRQSAQCSLIELQFQFLTFDYNMLETRHCRWMTVELRLRLRLR